MLQEGDLCTTSGTAVGWSMVLAPCLRSCHSPAVRGSLILVARSDIGSVGFRASHCHWCCRVILADCLELRCSQRHGQAVRFQY